MLAVNSLIHDAYESIGITGIGETTEGDYEKVGVKELNRAISQLNSDGYITLSQDWKDFPRGNCAEFKVFAPGETDEHAVNMRPPVSIVGVSRRLGNRFLPLRPGDKQAMATRPPCTLAGAWSYDIRIETGPDGVPRNVGKLMLDGDSHGEIRVWFNGQLPHYALEDTIYLPDIYNELIMSALCYRLACFHELSDQKKADCLVDFNVAKSLIETPNAQLRMATAGVEGGSSWRDSYADGLAGTGM